MGREARCAVVDGVAKVRHDLATKQQQTSEKSLEFGKIVLGEQLYNSASQIVPRKLGSPLSGYRAERHNRVKDREKEGFISCSK